MADIKLVERKFLLEKKKITLEECKLFIQEYHPEDKAWFYDLCLNPQPVEEGSEKKEILGFAKIKKAFYERYFPQEDTMSHRMKLFADWDIPAPAPEAAAKSEE